MTSTCSPASRTGGPDRTCVDAPLDASSFSVVRACDQVRSCVRPHAAAFNAAGPYGDLRTGTISLTRARGASSVVLVRPIPSRDRLPVRILRPAHIPDGTRAIAGAKPPRSPDCDRHRLWPSAPRRSAPCGWRARPRPACGASSPSCAPARTPAVRHDAPPSERPRPRR